jgi:hypothetical protein
MKSKKQLTRNTRKNSESGTSRRSFLKKTFAFAALTSTYSVVSLTQLACNDGSTSVNGGNLNGNYFGGDYLGGNYFDGDYFDGFFYY